MNINKKIMIALVGISFLLGGGATLMAQSNPHPTTKNETKKGKRCEICSRNEKTGQMECKPAPCP